MFKHTLAALIFPMVAVTLLTACGPSLRQRYEEPVIDRVTDQSGTRPEWVRKTPKQDGRILLVTSSTEGLSAESGTRLAKAYALAQLSEQANAAVKVEASLSTRGGNNQSISWNSQAMFRSIRQEDLYWEQRVTQEGVRYSVWALWSIPEKAFYEAQQQAEVR